ncbi:IMPACT family protein, partial [Vallitalea guaymasensis]
MVEKYLTIFEDNEAELVEKKSRFIATIKHVETEEEIKDFLEGIRKKYWNATHNVFAYTIGLKQPLERCSDDGEPSGTAGMPILEVIRGSKLHNVIVVVTRYFGGTLLGTGGLVRAYGG